MQGSRDSIPRPRLGWKFSGRAFIAVYITIMVTVLAATAAVNYTVDPHHLFHDGDIPRAAEALINGKSVVFEDNTLREVLLLKSYIGLNGQRDDVVVFGSSRANQLGAEMLGEDSTFNYFVSGGKTSDYVAFSQMLFEANLEPSRVVVAVDPWLFNARVGQGPRPLLTKEYNSALQRIGLEQHRVPLTPRRLVALMKEGLNKYTPLLSVRDLLSSIKDMSELKLGSLSRIRTLTDDEDTNRAIKRPDGTLLYPAALRNRSVDVVNQETLLSVLGDQPMYELKNFHYMDESLLLLFELWVGDLVARGIAVELMFFPYHPIAYDVIADAEQYQVVPAIEQYLQAFADASGLSLRGSWDPSVNGCADIDFFDGLHPRESCVSKVLARDLDSR
jgi:hypothetical protein